MNSIVIAGKVLSCNYAHQAHGVDIYEGCMEVKRKSGFADQILFRTTKMLKVGEFYRLMGSVHTVLINNRRSMFAKATSLEFVPEGTYENEVDVSGTPIKIGTLRKTPFGRTILDVLIKCGDNIRCYYPNIILWGNVATNFVKETSNCFDFKGRMQSRDYEKNGEIRTVHEISVEQYNV